MSVFEQCAIVLTAAICYWIWCYRNLTVNIHNCCDCEEANDE